MPLNQYLTKGGADMSQHGKKSRNPPIYEAEHPDIVSGRVNENLAANKLAAYLSDHFLDTTRFDDIPRTKGFVSVLRDMLLALGRTRVDNLERLTANIVSYVIDLLRENSDLKQQVDELNRQTDELANKTVQSESARIVTSESEKFIEELCEFLRLCVSECKEQADKYENHTDQLEQAFSELQEKIEGLRQEIASTDLDQCVFDIGGLIQVLETRARQIYLQNEVSDSDKQEVSSSLADIGSQISRFTQLQTEITEIIDLVTEHQRQIVKMNTGQAATLRAGIKSSQDEIGRVKDAFAAAGHEVYFWGLAYGLKDAFQFRPVDLQLYRVEIKSGEDPDIILTKEGLDQLMIEFEQVKKLVEEILRRGHEKPIDKSANSDKEKLKNRPHIDVEVDEKLPKNHYAGERFDQLSELSLCFLWGFIQRNIKKALEQGKKVIRGGDWGKASKVIARVLCQVGAITDIEKKIIISEVVKRLERDEMIVVKVFNRKDGASDRVFDLKSIRMTPKGRAMAAVLSQCDVADEYLPTLKIDLNETDMQQSLYYQKVMELSIKVDEETKQTYSRQI